MEINSILEEARRRSGRAQSAPSNGSRISSSDTRGASRGSAKSAPSRSAAPSSGARKTSQQRPAPRQRSLDDDFVMIDENGRINSSSGRKPAPKTAAPKKKSKTGLIVGVIIGVVLLLGAGGFTTWYFLSGSSQVLADNVSINGVSVGGMTTAEAKQALAGVENSLANGIKINVKAGNQTVTLTKENLDYSFNTDEVLEQAQAYSAEKGVKTGEQNYEITMKLGADSCNKAAKTVSDAANVPAKDAYVSAYNPSGSGSFTIDDETVGVKVKEQELSSALQGFVAGGKISGDLDAPVDQVQPKYTKSFLQNNIKQLSSFTTTSTNGSNGNNNMKVSLGACNGSIINPGETWSFNNCTGDSNKESNGYLPAGVIVEGRHETGVGGGICQSSTTIYNAACLVGMEVVERACHYYQSSYVDAGRDATIDYGNIDLKLKNPFDTQLFMKCYMDGVVLHCEMYGVEQEDFDEIRISSEVTSYFSNGFRAQTTRTYYKDGKAVRTESLPDSTYYTSAPSSGSSKASSKPSGQTSSSQVDSQGGGDSGGDDSGGGDSGGGESGGGDSGGGDSGGGDSGGGDSGGGDSGGESGGGDAAP